MKLPSKRQKQEERPPKRQQRDPAATSLPQKKRTWNLKPLLNKELHLSASPLTWLFLLFTGVTLIPDFPMLVGAIFACLGIFYSFHRMREDRDVLFSMLLPYSRRDVVRGKYLFVCVIEGIAFLLMAVMTVIRMLAYGTAHSMMMPPCPLFLAFALLVFAAFNWLFVGGFYRTVEKTGKPFARFLVVAVLLMAFAEALYHIPLLAGLFRGKGAALIVQFALMAAAAALCAVDTLLIYRQSAARFEMMEF